MNAWNWATFICNKNLLLWISWNVTNCGLCRPQKNIVYHTDTNNFHSIISVYLFLMTWQCSFFVCYCFLKILMFWGCRWIVSAVVKRELTMKLSIYRLIYNLTLSFGDELWVVTEKLNCWCMQTWAHCQECLGSPLQIEMSSHCLGIQPECFLDTP